MLSWFTPVITLNCSTLRFCNENLEKKPSTFSFISNPTKFDSFTFSANLLNEGEKTKYTLRVYYVKNIGFRIRVDLDEEKSKYRYNFEKDELVLNPKLLLAKEELTLTNKGDYYLSPRKNNAIKCRISSNPLRITIINQTTEVIDINSNNFMFIENGEHIDDVEYNNSQIETFPHGKTAVGIDFHFLSKSVKLTGLNEGNASCNLEDSLYRRYTRDTFSEYGYVPLLLAHTSKFEGITPSLFWMNPTDTFYEIKTSSKDRGVNVISEGGFIDFIVLVNDTRSVLDSYNYLTGKAPMPPAFAFGYHQSKYGYKTQEEVEKVMESLDEANFPVDVIWLDIDHLKNRQPFTVNGNRFPDIQEFFKKLNDQNRYVVRIADPHMPNKNGHAQFNYARDHNYLINNRTKERAIEICWPGLSSWPDFLRKEVREWWSEQFDYSNKQQWNSNVYIWNDMNEMSVFKMVDLTGSKDWLHFNNQIENREVHSLYGLSNTEATYQGLLKRDNYNKRPFLLSRSFFAGSQRSTWIWSGDNNATWNHLRLSVDHIITSGLNGMPFTGSDIGGFNQHPSDELHVRWFQVAAFSYPFYRQHSADLSPHREPYLLLQNHKDDIFKAILNVTKERYKLFPLWYTAAYHYTQNSDPLVTPLWYDYPEYEDMHNVKHQTLLDHRIMSVPALYENQTKVSVVKPPGRWFNYWTGEELMRDSDIEVTLDDILVYIKGGSIVPLYCESAKTIKEQVTKKLSLMIALDSNGRASGDFYMDDGESIDVKNNKMHTRFSFENGKLSFVTSGRCSNVSTTVDRITIYGAKAGNMQISDNISLDISQKSFEIILIESDNITLSNKSSQGYIISFCLLALAVILVFIILTRYRKVSFHLSLMKKHPAPEYSNNFV